MATFANPYPLHGNISQVKFKRCNGNKSEREEEHTKAAMEVEELWKSNVIPERFVRDDLDEQQSTVSHEQVPVIDISKLRKQEGSEEFHKEILKLKEGCEEWGFFQVVNHDVELKLMEKMEEVGIQFLGLPLEEKHKYPLEMDTMEGYGQAFVFSDDQNLDWSNMFALVLKPHHTRKPHLWPQNPPLFGEILEAYSAEIEKLCEDILEYIAVSLGLKRNKLRDMFGSMVESMKINYYPPCSRPDLVMGISPHSDGTAITVLQQGRKGNPVGLQILNHHKWVPVQPLPYAFLVNIGDTIEVLSNGKYRSVEHRAVTHQFKDRLSLAMFYSPSYSIELGPLEELLDENNPPKYRRYNHGDYARNYITNKLQSKINLDFAKISTHFSSA